MKSKNVSAIMQRLNVYHNKTGQLIGKGFVFYYRDRMSVPTLYDDNGLLPENEWYTLQITGDNMLVLVNETIQ